jgi:hypothetical protein
MMRQKGIYVRIRAFDEELDENVIPMRMIATWQAQETMERGVSERDNSSTFLAQGARRSEAACQPMI